LYSAVKHCLAKSHSFVIVAVGLCCNWRRR